MIYPQIILGDFGGGVNHTDDLGKSYLAILGGIMQMILINCTWEFFFWGGVNHTDDLLSNHQV